MSGVVEGLKIITRDKSSRIAKYAFDYAVRHDRKKVTAIHKANIMKLSDGLFLKECSAISKICLLYTSPSPRDRQKSRMPSSA